jgi:site-specific DNA recombinase
VPDDRAIIRCAIYTRKSSEEGLEQSFNSLEAQREACEAYIASQKHEHWKGLKTHYDDGGYSGGSMERPALRQLLEDIDSGKIDTLVVYKVDRLTRSLADFAKIIERFDARQVSFVSVLFDQRFFLDREINWLRKHRSNSKPATERAAEVFRYVVAVM